MLNFGALLKAIFLCFSRAPMVALCSVNHSGYSGSNCAWVKRKLVSSRSKPNLSGVKQSNALNDG